MGMSSVPGGGISGGTTGGIEFEIDPAAVRAASWRRVLIRAGVLLVLIALLGAAAETWLPPQARRLAWSFAVAIFAVHAAVELSALRWARRSAPTMVLRLSAVALELWIGATRHRMPWTDLGIARVRGSRGAIRSIELHSRHHGRVVLAGFRDMDALAQALTAAIAQAHADRPG